MAYLCIYQIFKTTSHSNVNWFGCINWIVCLTHSLVIGCNYFSLTCTCKQSFIQPNQLVWFTICQVFFSSQWLRIHLIVGYIVQQSLTDTVKCQINAPCALTNILVNWGGPGEHFGGFSANFAHFWPILAYF